MAGLTSTANGSGAARGQPPNPQFAGGNQVEAKAAARIVRLRSRQYAATTRPYVATETAASSERRPRPLLPVTLTCCERYAK